MSASALAQANAQPVMVLIRQHDSHPFNDRTIIVNEEIKVGRAVARLRSSPNNAIFDCKVLSRSHAIIWYADKKFWLRDTNSSNGTFVNNAKVVKEGDSEVAEREILSGDFIRFGVEVLEHGTTHGCIITQVKLYHPNGAEALPRNTYSVTKTENTAYTDEQVFQLTSHINEALFREKNIEKKFDDLKGLLSETQEVSKKSWKAMLNEDRLLEKLELYENQLQIFKNNFDDDALQTQIYRVLEEKTAMERKSKDAIGRILHEKTAALQRATELEHCLEDSERDLKRLRENLESSQNAYHTASTNLDEKTKLLEALEQKLDEASDIKSDLESRLQAKTEEFHALQVLHTVPTAKEQETDQVIRELVQQNEAMQSSLSEQADSIRQELAFAELVELDRYIDMQTSLEAGERRLERVLDTTSTQIESNLRNSARELNESCKFLKMLQEEFDLLENNIRAYQSSVPFLTNHKNSAAGEQFDEEHCVSSTAEECHLGNESEEKAAVGEDLARVLLRVRDLTSRLAASQASTEDNLINYIDNLNGGSGYMAIKSLDVIPASVADHISQVELCEASTQMTESQHDGGGHLSPLMAQSMFSSSELSTDLDFMRQSLMLSQGDYERLQMDYNAKAVENEELRRMLDDLTTKLDRLQRQESTTPLDDLDSLQQEYQVMREKMTMLEVEMSNCKVDYRRVVEESRKVNSELDLMRNSRDQLQVKLEDALNQNHSNSHHVVDQQRRPSSLSAYAVIPLMVLLCAVMFSILSRFSR